MVKEWLGMSVDQGLGTGGRRVELRAGVVSSPIIVATEFRAPVIAPGFMSVA